jgi:predicted GH43/DUF377 family glycosyl hydrolase
MIDRYLTPYKLQRPVLASSGVPGTFDENSVDGPFVFCHNGRFHMTYVGFDGRGYQTALAVSDDLLHWEKKGVILGRGADTAGWDGVGCAASSLLRQGNDLYALPRLKKVDGKYFMIYHAYPGYGYETGPAEMGLAWCEDEDLMRWHRSARPVFSWRDAQPWERGGLYKAWLMEHDGVYYIFYNAKDKDEWGWVEQTGVATSTDLLHWRRYGGNPVLAVTPGAWDSKFCSDPQVLYDSREKRWVMFYYGYDDAHAQDGVAFSDDLLHWQKHPEPILKVGTGDELDAVHAHKPYVLYHDDTLYHFYCACRPAREGDPVVSPGGEFRCITVAASRASSLRRVQHARNHQ